MNHIMKACIRCNPSGKKEAHKSFLFFLYSLKVNLSWGGKRQPWIRMKIKNILGRYEGRHSRKRGQLGQGTNKNMALFGSRKVIEYDLYIGWRGEGCEITQWEGPYMLCIIVSDFSSVVISMVSYVYQRWPLLWFFGIMLMKFISF